MRLLSVRVSGSGLAVAGRVARSDVQEAVVLGTRARYSSSYPVDLPNVHTNAAGGTQEKTSTAGTIQTLYPRRLFARSCCTIHAIHAVSSTELETCANIRQYKSPSTAYLGSLACQMPPDVVRNVKRGALGKLAT